MLYFQGFGPLPFSEFFSLPFIRFWLMPQCRCFKCIIPNSTDVSLFIALLKIGVSTLYKRIFFFSDAHPGSGSSGHLPLQMTCHKQDRNGPFSSHALTECATSSWNWLRRQTYNLALSTWAGLLGTFTWAVRKTEGT